MGEGERAEEDERGGEEMRETGSMSLLKFRQWFLPTRPHL